MYKEAIKFHKYVGIPVCILMVLCWFLTGCGSKLDAANNPGVEYIEAYEGVYQFVDENSNMSSGTLGITLDYNGRLVVQELETFRSENDNDTFGTHPRVGFTSQYLATNMNVYAADINYASGTDLEKDGTSSDLGTGKKYTVYLLEFTETHIYLTIQIHEGNTSSSGGINKVVINRTFTAER